jgi:2-dehydro-3-deoxyglucarate aldolase
MNKTTIGDRLRAGQPSIGSWMQIPHPSVAEIMGRAGFDWVAVDLEHGSFALETLPDICRALELGGTVPFARVAQCACKDIKEALEVGCRGIIVPMVETREQMQQAVAWAKYPPEGVRGVGYSRANLFGKHFADYVSRINEELVMVAQIESIQAVRNLDAILSVKGVDALIVGPYDLSASMGITAQFDHADFKRALAEIESAAARCRIPLGMHVVQPDVKLLQTRITEGYRFIAYGIDAVFLYNFAINPLKDRF